MDAPMPRLPRHFLPGLALHVIQRGNNRQACFFTDRDYVVYLDKLNEYARKISVSIHSYVELNPVRAGMVKHLGIRNPALRARRQQKACDTGTRLINLL
jgi:hypothetical protein